MFCAPKDLENNIINREQMMLSNRTKCRNELNEIESGIKSQVKEIKPINVKDPFPHIEI